MTEHELQLLAAGASIGSYLTLLSWMIADYVSGRRADRRRRQQAAKRAATHNWRDITRRAAEPHPAEILEATVRDFELNLYDAVDRVEDAMRRDGLL